MKNVFCFGEIIWDIIDGEAHLGGAPLNAAVCLAGLGASVTMVSGVGNDEAGRKSLEILTAKGVSPKGVGVFPNAETGKAEVTHQGGENRFVLNRPAAYDFTAVPALTELPTPQGIVFGTLAAYRSTVTAEALSALLQAYPDCVRFYDVNLRKDNFDLPTVRRLAGQCTVLKCNDEEVAYLGPALFGVETDIPAFARAAMSEFGCKCVVVTCGGKGAMGVTANGCIQVPGIRNKVVDTVGAGDAFSAGFLFEYLSTGDFAEALYAGNLQGAKCVTHAGAF